MNINDLIEKCRQLAKDDIIGENTVEDIIDAFKWTACYPDIEVRFIKVIDDLLGEIEQERIISDCLEKQVKYDENEKSEDK